jgi:hypothetical protein
MVELAAKLGHRAPMHGVEDFRRRALLFGGGLALIGLVVLAIFAPGVPPPSLADGLYVSRCCGSVAFKAGKLMVEGQAVPYELTRDKLGLVAVPAFYVGVSEASGLLLSGRNTP